MRCRIDFLIDHPVGTEGRVLYPWAGVMMGMSWR
jgi:hypothetical protein